METCVSYWVPFSHNGPIGGLIGALSPSALECERSLYCSSESFNFLQLEGGKILIRVCRLGLMIPIVAGGWRAKVPNYHLRPLLFTGASECTVDGARSPSRSTGSESWGS